MAGQVGRVWRQAGSRQRRYKGRCRWQRKGQRCPNHPSRHQPTNHLCGNELRRRMEHNTTPHNNQPTPAAGTGGGGVGVGSKGSKVGEGGWGNGCCHTHNKNAAKARWQAKPSFQPSSHLPNRNPPSTGIQSPGRRGKSPWGRAAA